MSQNKKLINFLSQFITSQRFELFKKIADNRTDYLTVVLENIYQPHNASAVLRTCDCFGINNIHIIENDNKFIDNAEISLGASKWVNILNYNQEPNNTIQTLDLLKNAGYRLIAATPHGNTVNIDNFDLNKGKFALMFGSEQPGLSSLALEKADEFVKLPMYGFTESFNISVSVALFLSNLISRLHKSDINFLLEDNLKDELLLKWLRLSIKSVDLLEKKFFT